MTWRRLVDEWPEDGQECLAAESLFHESEILTWRECDLAWWSNEKGYYRPGILWMPLPAPPEGEG